MAVAVSRAHTIAAGVAVAAQELGDFCFQRRLKHQPGTESGDILQDVTQVAVGDEQLVDLGADALHRRS
jgi:hypothetical protein